MTDQTAVVAFLSALGTIAPGIAAERVDTHGAHVFLAGDFAVKIKRAVSFSYMDFSTPELRHLAIQRELAINRVTAPDIYLDVVAITRKEDGGLQLGGSGVPVEWALRMRRFEQAALLSNLARQGLSLDLLKALADEVYRTHQSACVAQGSSRSASLPAIVQEIADALGRASTLAEDVRRFRDQSMGLLETLEPLLSRRAAAGMTRRCHGDLHLDNIVLWNGRPTLFDAIEFDEALATIDMLYDLAFLLMDLEKRAGRAAANVVLNRYLWRSQSGLDLEGLAALPLFLAVRAGVRAMVSVQRAGMATGDAGNRLECDARSYLSVALGYLAPPPPLLVAIGGFSGTGKSTLAASLAPRLGPAPGAVHLRSDLERKALHGADELTRLPESAYAPAESARVYDVVESKARAVLAAGHAIVVDAVFSAPSERTAIEAVARERRAPFVGLWLQADAAELAARIAARSGDASDATETVLHAQMQRGAGTICWQTLDASGDRTATLAHAERTLVALGHRLAMPG